MENKENKTAETNKIIETLTKELEGLNPEGLQEFFKFFYQMNHNHGNMITQDNFEEFLETFDSNPFKVNEDKKFRKQLIDAVIKYSHDLTSLITAAVLMGCVISAEERCCMSRASPTFSSPLTARFITLGIRIIS